MSKKKIIKTLTDQLTSVAKLKDESNTVILYLDSALMVHIPPKIKLKMVEVIKLKPNKAERLVKIANIVDSKQLEYIIDKNLY